MLELWAVARYDLGLSDDEVGSLTVREFDALLTRKRENDNRSRFNAGIVAAAIYNAAPFSGEERRAISPLDFVPEWQERARGLNVDLTELTPEEQRDRLLKVFGNRITRVN